MARVHPRDKESGAPISGRTIKTLSYITSRRENLPYYEHECNGNGVNFLVNRSAHNCPLPSPNLSPDEILFHLLMCLLCQYLSRTKRAILSRIIALAVKLESSPSNPHCIPPRFPTEPNHIRTMYMDSVNSISENIPRPKVDRLENHSYVSLFEVVSHFLSTHSKNLKFISMQAYEGFLETSESNVRNAFQSKRFRMLLDNAKKKCVTGNPKILWATMWSDDHEPNNVVQNRGSVHLVTISIGNPNFKKNGNNVVRQGTDTYPLSMSAKSSDHEEIEVMLARELRRFSRSELSCDPVFVTDMRTNIEHEVYLEVVASLQDQSERRSSNKLLGGNSQFHCRWQWSCDVGFIARNLTPCNSCFDIMVRQKRVQNNCKKCLFWDFDRDSVDKNLTAYPAPVGYQAEKTLGNIGSILPFRHETISSLTQSKNRGIT